MLRRVKLGLALAAASIAGPATASGVACHLTYGGETQVLLAQPVDTPYAVAPVAIGSYFLFRIVYRAAPAELAGIKLYTYADRDSGPVIIHQASHPLPAANAAVHGFTGLNFVYEPVRDGELQYWCEWQTAGQTQTEAAK